MLSNCLNAQDKADVISLIRTLISKVSRLEVECKAIHSSIEELYPEVES
jgi:uncharacterized protein (UPF0335 family)